MIIKLIALIALLWLQYGTFVHVRAISPNPPTAIVQIAPSPYTQHCIDRVLSGHLYRIGCYSAASINVVYGINYGDRLRITDYYYSYAKRSYELVVNQRACYPARPTCD
jgi:hypothetical protein